MNDFAVSRGVQFSTVIKTGTNQWVSKCQAAKCVGSCSLKFYKTADFSETSRKNFCRMCITHFPTIHDSVTTWCQHWRGGPQVKMFEKVLATRYHHWVSGSGQGVPTQWGPMSRGRWCSLYSEVQWITVNRMTQLHDWKHCLPTTSLAGGKNKISSHG